MKIKFKEYVQIKLRFFLPVHDSLMSFYNLSKLYCFRQVIIGSYKNLRGKTILNRELETSQN